MKKTDKEDGMRSPTYVHSEGDNRKNGEEAILKDPMLRNFQN